MPKVRFFLPAFSTPAVAIATSWGREDLTEPYLGCMEYLSPGSFSAASTWERWDPIDYAGRSAAQKVSEVVTRWGAFDRWGT